MKKFENMEILGNVQSSTQFWLWSFYFTEFFLLYYLVDCFCKFVIFDFWTYMGTLPEIKYVATIYCNTCNVEIYWKSDPSMLHVSGGVLTRNVPPIYI